MSFSGSNSGIIYLIGKPVYNDKDKTIEIRDIDFDVKTKNFLMKKAAWMFNRKITNEISSRSRYDLSSYIDSAKYLMNSQLNREWMKGVKNSGVIKELKIAGIYPLSDNLIIRSNASGSLEIKVDAINF
jgi:hypothetical protein